MATVSNGTEGKRRPMGLPARGSMHPWRTAAPDIPCPVVSPQCRTLFLSAGPWYHSLQAPTNFQAPLDTVAMPRKIHEIRGAKPAAHASAG